MLKLISINCEYQLHSDTIFPFLEKENADCVCLQEVPDFFIERIEALGYQTSYAPMLRKEKEGIEFPAGVLIGTKVPHTADTHYYYRAQPEIVLEDEADRVGTISQPLLRATFNFQETSYTIGTVHLVKSDRGEADEHQNMVASSLLEHLAEQPPLVLVGDFNMPRGVNSNYERFCEQFTDTIPEEYTSSLDKSLYKKEKFDGSPIDQFIFEKFMVDYIFTQEPYEAKDVRLQFGVSDHAAVVGTIYKK